MPFTPFHFGPGAAFKAIGGTHFSFLVFCGTQVLMDIEVAVQIVLGTVVLHGHTHTLAGAAAVGALGAATGKPITAWVLARSGEEHAPLTWTAATTGAFVGSYSHVALDAIMHIDTRPFWPLGDANPFIGVVSMDALHILCAVSGVVGGAVVALRLGWRRAQVRGAG